MFERKLARRVALLLAAACLAVTASACGDDEDEAEDAASSVAAVASEAGSEASSAVESASSEAESAVSDATESAAEATESAESATEEAPAAESVDLSGLTGKVAVDGSSTVAPIAQAIAEDFSAAAGGVEATVGTSGTGGGFEKFCAGETDIATASREIEDDEVALCEQGGVEHVGLQIGSDALTIAVNVENDWATCLTTEELKNIWNEGSTVANWSEIKPDFPDEALTLYGPGTDSGTFDYFTDVINGEEGVSRSDYTASEDDNVLVQGVAGDPGALGYFGFAYYLENQDTVKALEVDSGGGCVAPSPETVLDGSYTPLARPLFIYVAKASVARPEVKAFVDFFLAQAPTLVEEVQYIPLPAEGYAEATSTFAEFAGA